MIDNGSYDDDCDVTYDGKRTSIIVDEDLDGCSAYYRCDIDDARHSVSPAYEIHKLMVGDYLIEFDNYGNGNVSCLQITSTCTKNIPNVDLKNELRSAIQTIVSDEVELCDTIDEEFNNDWTEEEIVEEIESQLESYKYIKVDGIIYPADDWEDIVESLFDGEEPDKDRYTTMDKHEVAEQLAEDIDCEYY